MICVEKSILTRGMSLCCFLTGIQTEFFFLYLFLAVDNGLVITSPPGLSDSLDPAACV